MDADDTKFSTLHVDETVFGDSNPIKHYGTTQCNRNAPSVSVLVGWFLLPIARCCLVVVVVVVAAAAPKERNVFFPSSNIHLVFLRPQCSLVCRRIPKNNRVAAAARVQIFGDDPTCFLLSWAKLSIDFLSPRRDENK